MKKWPGYDTGLQSLIRGGYNERGDMYSASTADLKQYYWVESRVLIKINNVKDNDTWLMFGILPPTIADQHGWNGCSPDNNIDLFHWLFDEILT